jgi:membrane associated rhomboid family serine protease
MSYTGNRFGNPFGFQVTPWVKKLLIANGAVFLLTMAFSGLVPLLAFTPALALYQPWSIITYMFVHGNFFHIFINMLVLFFFGPPLEDRWGSHEFLKFYVIAGIGGALLSLVFWNIAIVGASAAVYGVMLAFAMYWPDNPIYVWGIFPIKAKWLVGGLIGLSVFYALTGGAPGTAHLAHLGGAAAAFIYLRSSFSPGPFGPRPTKPKKAKPAGGTAVTQLRARSVARPVVQRTAANHEEEQLLDEIDRILDKISARGMESLTAEERVRLDEASRRFKSD